MSSTSPSHLGHRATRAGRSSPRRRRATGVALALLLPLGTLAVPGADAQLATDAGTPVPSAPAAETAGIVRGVVRDADGTPLAGATVSIDGLRRGALVRDDGSFRFAAPPGRYELRVRMIGYASRADSITVAAGVTVVRDFALSRVTTMLSAVTTLATRAQPRSVLDAPAPVDVLPAAELRSTGRTETAQILQALAPSVNFPRTSLGDGTDHVRPATLRGLAPDQVLVLVNGKRRHASALVNVNGFVGRGSQAVDLNAIPASLVDRIEILRDGAAAQYGSDAIAGVVNIVLKGEPDAEVPGDLTLQVGQTTRGDGDLLSASAGRGWRFGQSGFLFTGAELRDRGPTNRAAPDTRQQYFTGDPRNDDPSLPVPGRIDYRYGDADTRDAQAFLNAGTTLSSGVELFAFGGGSRRVGDAGAFWRRPMDDNNLRELYPDGFLPVIQSDVADLSGVIGARGTRAGWSWELSGGWGRNAFDYDVVNTVNVSLGPDSPTRFWAGQLAFSQATANLDLSRELAVGLRAPLHVALGAEARRDHYEISAGDSASWANGGHMIHGPDGAPTDRPAPVGSQGFPGYRPQDAGAHARSNIAGYIDLSTELAPRLTLSAAGRTERYSDFGGTTTGKLAARWEPIRGWALRGTASTGFRAPSLGQQFYASTSTSFVGTPLVPLEIRTLPASSPEAALLGARSLRPERSVNLGAGLVVQPARTLAVTADLYRIDVDDRIVLSSNFTGSDVRAVFDVNGLTGLQGARYFTNAIDTRTQGVDVVANWATSLRSALLRITAGYNANRTEVTRIDTTSILGGHSDQLFNRVERTRIERGQPRDAIVLSSDLTQGRLGLTVRTQRFGKVTSFGSNPDGSGDQTYGAKWISDLAVRFGPVRGGTITLGADNLFDVYPDRPIPANSNSGIFPYSATSPFGFNGRFVYARLSIGL